MLALTQWLMRDRLFHVALFISLCIHLGLLISLSSSKNKILKKPLKQIELTYQSVKPKQTQKQKVKVQKVELLKQKKQAEDVDILSRREETLIPIGKEIVKDITRTFGKLGLSKKTGSRIKTLDVNRKITVPILKSEKIANPKYLSYNQSIRQKIRQRAYGYVEHPDFQAGDVYLTFVLAATGQLQQIKIIEDKTRANPYLRNVGLRSIEESSPFPPFPKDLSYPELTFNVIISFEINE